MTSTLSPRVVTSVLVEELDNRVVVTWGLGDVVAENVEYFGYEVYYYGPDDNGGKRLGVRFGTAITAYVWENSSNTQANYTADAVELRPDAIVVQYWDAELGLPELGTILAFSHIEGRDEQLKIPVTLLR